MRVNFKPYNQKDDFLRVRDFIVKIHKRKNPFYNWTIERWNYAYHAVIHILGTSIEIWENRVGLWENENDDIVAVVTSEGANRSEVHFIIDPDYQNKISLDELFNFAENNHVCEINGKQMVRLRITDGDLLKEKIAHQRGYIKIVEEGYQENISSISLNRDFEYDLPEDFIIKTMAENNDIEKRTLAFAKSFGNYGTEDEVKSNVYVELQKAPDYRKELDVYIEAPNGDFASVALIWYDEINKIAILEHVGTDPKYRKMGLAKAANYEAIKLVKKLGCKKVLVGSDQDFYKAIGFEIEYYVNVWQKIFQQ